MDYSKYINGVSNLSRTVCIEQSKPKEKDPGIYMYTGTTPNKVPSIALEAGEPYFSVKTEAEFTKVWSRMRKQHVRKNTMSLFPLVQYFRQFCERDGYSIVFIPCHSSK